MFNSNEEINYRSVAEFYEGKSVFITGATGFLGKVLLERLLWNCPKLDKIYILVREKNGVSVNRRMEELFNSVLFAKLKQNRPDDLKKVIPIPGDITMRKFGMKKTDQNILFEKVNIAIHTAATIKFNETLKQALTVNLEGTVQMLNLCYRMKNLESYKFAHDRPMWPTDVDWCEVCTVECSDVMTCYLIPANVCLTLDGCARTCTNVLVHTSTAYTNTDKKLIEEIVYSSSATLYDIYAQVIENTDADFTKVLNGQPNTYTFTKAAAENLIFDVHKDITTIIIRPSIVTACADQPLPGWIDNWYGATAILASIGKGINRVLWGNIDNIVDLIPVDYVANFLLVATAKGQKSKDVVVYNCCSSFNNPITFRSLLRTFVDDNIKHRDYIFPFPQLYFMTNNKLFGTILTVFLQILPAYIADFLSWILGKPTGFVKLQKRSVAQRELVKFFTSNSWIMQNSGARALYASLSTSDQIQFPCDTTQLNWNDYIPLYCAGIRRYLENK